MKNTQLKIVNDADNVIETEVLEQAIVDLAKGFKKLNASRLTRRAVVLLVQDACGAPVIPKASVEAVLDAAANLDTRYLKKPKP